MVNQTTTSIRIGISNFSLIARSVSKDGLVTANRAPNRSALGGFSMQNCDGQCLRSVSSRSGDRFCQSVEAGQSGTTSAAEADQKGGYPWIQANWQV